MRMCLRAPQGQAQPKERCQSSRAAAACWTADARARPGRHGTALRTHNAALAITNTILYRPSVHIKGACDCEGPQAQLEYGEARMEFGDAIAHGCPTKARATMADACVRAVPWAVVHTLDVQS